MHDNDIILLPIVYLFIVNYFCLIIKIMIIYDMIYDHTLFVNIESTFKYNMLLRKNIILKK